MKWETDEEMVDIYICLENSWWSMHVKVNISYVLAVPGIMIKGIEVKMWRQGFVSLLERMEVVSIRMTGNCNAGYLE